MLVEVNSLNLMNLRLETELSQTCKYIQDSSETEDKKIVKVAMCKIRQEFRFKTLNSAETTVLTLYQRHHCTVLQ